MLMLCVGLIAARANGADAVRRGEQRPLRDGNVFCNGIRLDDEIVVVNTRMALRQLRSGIAAQRHSR